MAPDKWVNNVRELLRLAWLNEPSLNLFCEVLRDEYQRRGVFDGSGDWPSMSDMIEALQRLSPPRGSDRAKARDKLLDRLESLRTQLPGLDVQRSRDFRKLMDRSVILDVSDVKDMALPVMFTFLVTLFREVYRSEGAQDIVRMMVIEEAHQVLGGQTDRRTADLKESTPSGVLRDLRKTGTCGVVVSQLIQDVAPSVRGNLGSVICLRQGQRESVRHAAASLNLKPWQEDEIAKLPNRHAIAHFSRHGEPIYLAVKDASDLFPPGTPHPTVEEARERSQPVLEAIPFVKRRETPVVQVGAGRTGCRGRAEPDDGLHSRNLKVYARIAERPWELIQDRMDALGLDRDSEGAVRAALEAGGLIVFAGLVGAKNRLVELTAHGRAVAEERGLTVARTREGERGARVDRGVYAAVPGKTLLHLPVPEGGRIPDHGWPAARPASVDAGGWPHPRPGVLPKPAGLRGGRADETPQARAARSAHADKVDFVLCVAVNRRHKAAIQRALEERNGGKMPGRIVLLDFDTITDAAFDWAEVFEMEI